MSTLAAWPLRSILAVTSAGGVLLDVRAVAESLAPDRVAWLAVDAADTRSLLAGPGMVHTDVTWTTGVSPRRPLGLLAACIGARRLIHRLRPDLVISAGSGVAVPAFLAAKAARVRCAWIETYNLTGGHQGLSARVCTRLAEAVVVQRQDRLHLYHRAVFVGALI